MSKPPTTLLRHRGRQLADYSQPDTESTFSSMLIPTVLHTTSVPILRHFNSSTPLSLSLSVSFSLFLSTSFFLSLLFYFSLSTSVCLSLSIFLCFSQFMFLFLSCLSLSLSLSLGQASLNTDWKPGQVET